MQKEEVEYLTQRWEELVSSTQDVTLLHQPFLPIFMSKFVNGKFTLMEENDLRLVIRSNNTFTFHRNSLHRVDTQSGQLKILSPDICDKITQMKVITVPELFLYTDSYGDRNYHHWIVEQAFIMIYFAQLLKDFPNLKASSPSITISESSLEK